LFVIHKFTCGVDLGTLWGVRKEVPLVTIDGLDINVPPKGDKSKRNPQDARAADGDRVR